jgi:hypothetical protein
LAESRVDTLNSRSRAALAKYAIRKGLIDGDG